MANVLIRDVPEAVLAAVDARAARVGLSRAEYIRRRLAADASTSDAPVSVDDLRELSEHLPDLANASVMDGAWQ